MNMSEFNEDSSHRNGAESDFSHFSIETQELPEDFSEEDLAFAQELQFLLVPELEKAPPYYVQTLLESEDPRFQAVESGFEKKVRARVFRRLNLPRFLYRSRRPSTRTMVQTLSFHRPFFAVIAACMTFMVLTMLIAGPAFASGLAILFASGKHTGVVQVNGYPSEISPMPSLHNRVPTSSAPGAQHADIPQRLDLLEVKSSLHFSMYWPDIIPDNYHLKNIFLYQDASQDWADGPILQMDYKYALPGIAPRGSGRIAIYEFKPLGKGEVLQVVQSGAARQIKIDTAGHAVAIYIDGQWEDINQPAGRQWVYGGRSELIYEHNGVIFWIMGDQLDGVDGNVLLSIASSFMPFDGSHATRMGGYSSDIAESYNDTPPLFADDIIFIDNSDGLLGEADVTPTKSIVKAN